MADFHSFDSRTISIHAPPRGATFCQSPEPRSSHFNSRPSARGDPKEGKEMSGFVISIHAPPRGATSTISRPAADQLFQFTPLREGRQHHQPTSSRPVISIHAPPRGATPYYNAQQTSMPISIHAPPRGATAKDMQFLQIFCSTLTNQHGLTIVPRNLSRLFW